MIQQLGRLAAEARRTWGAFVAPRDPEEEAAARRRLDDLPPTLRVDDQLAVGGDVDALCCPTLRVDDQLLGTHSAGCTATYGVMERCDFYCTACYLADEANHTPPLPFEEIKAQLDLMRAYVGPWGNAQITAGEVTLLPCDDLIRILKYCREVQLSPMVMTHGQTFLKDPGYLERLVHEAGLEQVAIHIDTTQRGRLGMKKSDREPDIHWIRNAFAGLVRDTRRRTGKPLNAAHTFTVTEQNVQDLPEVVRWCVENADAFRLLSLQPTADVGRTKAREQVGRRDFIWQQVCAGLGIEANPEAMTFGHPACNTVSLNFVVHWDHDQYQVVEVTAADPRSTRFFKRLMMESFAGFTPDREPAHVVAARVLGRLRKAPDLLWRVPGYCGYRAWTERDWLPAFLGAVARGRPWWVRPLAVVVHNFMSAHELETPEGQDRLAACAFKVPIDGRMVSMCELNGTDLRRDLNTRDRDRLVAVREPRRRAG